MTAAERMAVNRWLQQTRTIIFAELARQGYTKDELAQLRITWVPPEDDGDIWGGPGRKA